MEVTPQGAILTKKAPGISAGNPALKNTSPINNKIIGETTNFKIDIEIDSNVKLSIYNLKGQLVHEHNFGYLNLGLYSYEFNASNLTSGNYIYIIGGIFQMCRSVKPDSSDVFASFEF